MALENHPAQTPQLSLQMKPSFNYSFTQPEEERNAKESKVRCSKHDPSGIHSAAVDVNAASSRTAGQHRSQ